MKTKTLAREMQATQEVKMQRAEKARKGLREKEMKTVQKTPADIVIETFGGLSKLAKILGHTNVTTIQGWKERGIIPARQQPIVYAAAQKEGKFLTLGQIMGVEE